MKHQLTAKKFKRLNILKVLSYLFPTVAVAALVLLGGLAGLAIAVVLGYLTYHLYKMLRAQLKEHVLTHDDGLSFFKAIGDVSRIQWDAVTHSGVLHREGKPRLLFVYDENGDSYLGIPDYYTEFDALIEEVKSRVPYFVDETIDKDELLKDYLVRSLQLDLPQEDNVH